VAAACIHRKAHETGKPQGVVSDDQAEAREGQAGRPGVAERFVVPRKPGTPVEGRDLSSRQTQYVVKDLGDVGNLSNSNTMFRSCRWRYTRRREVLSRAGCGEICLSGSMSGMLETEPWWNH